MKIHCFCLPPFSRRLLLTSMGVLLTPFAAASDTKPEEVLITANRFAQLASDSLTAHSVFDRDTIENSSAGDLFALLQTAPGVQLARAGVDGAQTSLFLRGSNSNHTLILLDGVRLNTASEGAARLEHLPLSQIERIEVIRGPQSSLYGADAIGGVIQIFTRSGLDTAAVIYGTETPYDGRIEAGVGTEASRNAHAGFRAKLNRTVIDVALSHQETEGIPAQNAPVPSTVDAGWQNQSLSLGVTHNLTNDWQLWAHYLATESEKLFDGGDSEASQRTGSAGVRGRISEKWDTQLQLSRFKDDNLTRQWGDSVSTTWRNSLQWQNNLSLIRNGNTVIGVDIDSEKLDYLSTGAVLNVNERNNKAVFFVHQQDLGVFNLSSSARVDDNEQFGEHITGRIAAGLDISSNTSLWTSVSTAFKAPTLVDLYVDFPAFFFYANPLLKPEKARSAEAGIRTRALDTALEINVFHNQIRDLIGTDASFSSLTNISRARINGLELAASRDILGWQSQLSLTLMTHKNRDTGASLMRRPRQQASLSASRSFGNLNVLLDWQLRSEQTDLDPVSYGRSRVAGYGVLDSVFTWHMTPATRLQVRIGNLFDKDYEVVDGFNTLGRHGMVRIRHQF